MVEDEKYELPSVDGAPWLIGLHENDDATLEEQTFFSMNNNTSYVKKIVELQGKSIVGSSVGWLILQDRVNDTMYSLWNPITRQSILLPELLGTPDGRYPEKCLLTSPPYEDDFDDNATKCVVLFFFRGAVFSCRITSRRDDYRWVKQHLTYRGLSVQLYISVAMNGEIYSIAHTSDRNDLVDSEDEDDVDNEDDYIVDNEADYDVNNNEQEDDDVDNTDDLFIRLKVSDHSDGRSNLVRVESLRARPPFSRILYKMGQTYFYYLVEVSGDMYAIKIIRNPNGWDFLKVFIRRLDLSEMRWIQVESLGDRALLLGDYCCTWCWAYESHGRIEGNCIYVASSKRDIIRQYRLQDNSYTLVSSHSNFCSCSEGPIWFMPRNPTRFPSLIEKTEERTIVENIEHVELLEETSTEIVPASSLLQFPTEILISIADCMHLFDYMNFRATCKIMRSEIPKPQGKVNSPFPLFMFLSNTQGICELRDPCYQNNGSITTKLPYSPSIVSTIEFCKDGWLILCSIHEKGCDLQYMNLFTRESGNYPTKSLGSRISRFAFSTCPTSPDCLTVGINAYYTRLQISLFQAGNDEWRVFAFDNIEGEFYSNYKSSPKFHNGAFYFLDEKGNLGVFKMVQGEWSWETHKGPKLGDCYIVELGGQLVYVYIIPPVGSSIQVYTFDMNQKLWVELKSLGDYTVFVSAASSLSVPTKDSSMRNRIYLPKRIGNEMVFYSLDTEDGPLVQSTRTGHGGGEGGGSSGDTRDGGEGTANTPDSHHHKGAAMNSPSYNLSLLTVAIYLSLCVSLHIWT